MGEATHTPFAGVMGWPLEHTLSPAIHNAGFRAAGLAWTYLSWPVHPERLRAGVNGLIALGAVGANITIPHKETVVPMLDGLSGDADAIGAVNTIQRLGDRLIGHNTDVDGFAEFLTGDAGCEVSGRSAVVLGAGGAARAIGWALRRAGADLITVVARDRTKGEEVAGLAEGSYAPWEQASDLATEADIVVNATPLRKGVLEAASFHPGQVVVDLSYNPPEPAFLVAARSAGADAWGGLGMLVRQAAASFTIWSGQAAPLEAMSAAAVRSIAAHP